PAAIVHDTLERRLVRVGIQAQAAVGDPPQLLHVRGLDDQKPGAGIGEHPEMREVPVVGTSIVGAVLAHPGHDDAIVDFKASKRERREQSTGHGGSIGLWLRRNGAARSFFSATREQSAKPGHLCYSWISLR